MLRKNITTFICLLTISFICAEPAIAQLFSHKNKSWQTSNRRSSMHISVGQAFGEANELVYCQPVSGCPVNHKLSQLIWETEQLTMFTAGFRREVGDVRLNLEVKLPIEEGEGLMDDYDWLYTNRSDWSHWSNHPDTTVADATTWDMSLDFKFLSSSSTDLDIVLGYKHETWAWESRGGSYIYSDTGSSGFRDQSGTFTPVQLVISYEQKFKFPYLGIKLNHNSINWNFHARYTYSIMVNVSAIDHHHLRNLTFVDTFGDGEMNAYEVGLTFKFNRNLGLIATYNHQEYKEVRGETTTLVSSTGAISGYCVDCAGADNTNSLWSFGVSYEY